MKAVTRLVDAGTSKINNMSVSSGSPYDPSSTPTSSIPTSPTLQQIIPHEQQILLNQPPIMCTKINIICPYGLKDGKSHHNWQLNGICKNCNCIKNPEVDYPI
jgi:hypothetical protein